VCLREIQRERQEIPGYVPGILAMFPAPEKGFEYSTPASSSATEAEDEASASAACPPVTVPVTVPVTAPPDTSSAWRRAFAPMSNFKSQCPSIIYIYKFTIEGF
jgi:hypothetical protein